MCVMEKKDKPASKMKQILWTFLLYFRFLVDKIIDFLFSLYWDPKWQPMPDLEKEHSFLAESAVTLARKIQEKELKSEDLVRAVIARMKQVNPLLNAVVQDRYDAAIEEAKKVDEMIAAGPSEDAKKKPFLGVPFTTKESHEVAGLRLTMGLWSRREAVGTEDSDTVAMLKDAGAILVATTNLPELLMWQETRNPVYGMTNNPHHVGRSPGGSSGAEAALVATYATTISLCSDIGGSTRMPAFYCGMFGHHPTPGTTKLKGVFFRKEESESSILSLGFVARHAEDLAPLVKVITAHSRTPLDLDRRVDVKDIKFYYTTHSKDMLVSPIRPDLRNAMTRVVSKLQQVVPQERRPVPYYHAGLDHMYQLWAHAMDREPDNFAALYHNNRGEANAYVELAKKVLSLSHHCLSSVIRLLEIQLLSKVVPHDWAGDLLDDLKKDLFAKLGDNGVLLFPSSPHAAPYHYSCFLRPWNFSYWALGNAIRCPVTQVPLGVNSEGLPIGIQVMAAPYNDALCLSVAAYLEKEFGGAVMAAKIKK